MEKFAFSFVCFVREAGYRCNMIWKRWWDYRLKYDAILHLWYVNIFCIATYCLCTFATIFKHISLSSCHTCQSDLCFVFGLYHHWVIVVSLHSFNFFNFIWSRVIYLENQCLSIFLSGLIWCNLILEFESRGLQTGLAIVMLKLYKIIFFSKFFWKSF